MVKAELKILEDFYIRRLVAEKVAQENFEGKKLDRVISEIYNDGSQQVHNDGEYFEVNEVLCDFARAYMEEHMKKEATKNRTRKFFATLKDKGKGWFNAFILNKCLIE